jgi:hypothetical protein
MITFRPLALSTVLIACLLPGCSASAAQPQTPAQPQLGSQAKPSEETPPPAEPVDIRGRVTQARRNGQGELPVGTLRIEGALEPGTRYDKAVVHIGHKTKVFLGRNGKPASFSFIHSGDLVEVIFDGPVAEVAEPEHIKATAARIVILEHIP